MKYNKDTFVYFLLKNNKIVYVGQTKNGFNRINEHILDKNKEFDDYKVIKCNESELNELENKLIIKYNPIYNKHLNCFNVRYTYIERKLKEKLKINPYSIKFIKEIIHKSNVNKQTFRNDEVLLKSDADKIVNYLIEKYYSFDEIVNYFDRV